MQDETQDKETKRYSRWHSEKMDAKETVRNAFPEAVATLPPTSPEERLQRVLGALEGLCKQQVARDGTPNWWTEELRKLVKESA